MRTTRQTRRGWLAAAAAAAAVLALVALAGGAAAEGNGAGHGGKGDPPAEPQAPPDPGPAPAPDAPAAAAPTQGPDAPPRIVRVVCTDRICGNCDGKCHRGSGHVAVDKKGHCACTPTEGSALDRATRDAYAKNTPQ